MAEEPLSELTYAKIEANMRRVLNRMDEVTKLYARSSEARARASAAYDVAKSAARTERRYQPHTEGQIRVTDQVAEDYAIIATEDERLAYEIAKAENEAAKQSLLTCRAQLDGLRSLMSSYRLQDGGN